MKLPQFRVTPTLKQDIPSPGAGSLLTTVPCTGFALGSWAAAIITLLMICAMRSEPQPGHAADPFRAVSAQALLHFNSLGCTNDGNRLCAGVETPCSPEESNSAAAGSSPSVKIRAVTH